MPVDTVNTHPKRIVPIFSGGGTRLPAYLGILQALKELDIQFNTLVGVSGGSIIAAMYACGHSIGEMQRLANETDFKQFTGFSLLGLLRHGGLSNGDHFEQWIDRHLQGATFADADLRLHILATDLNGGGPVVFNRDRTPSMKLSKAIRFSMSIPLIFSFKLFEDKLLTDGAILAEDALFEDWEGNGTPSVCFRLKSQPKPRAMKPSLIPLTQYVTLLIRTFMTAVSREYVNAQYWHNTLVVNTGEISAVDFTMDDNLKNELYTLGLETTKRFLPMKLSKRYP